jgi:hypothetical protein
MKKQVASGVDGLAKQLGETKNSRAARRIVAEDSESY